MTEVVFTCPGLGTMTLTAIQNHDDFLLIAYLVIDPHTKLGMKGTRS